MKVTGSNPGKSNAYMQKLESWLRLSYDVNSVQELESYVRLTMAKAYKGFGFPFCRWPSASKELHSSGILNELLHYKDLLQRTSIHKLMRLLIHEDYGSIILLLTSSYLKLMSCSPDMFGTWKEKPVDSDIFLSF